MKWMAVHASLPINSFASSFFLSTNLANIFAVVTLSDGTQKNKKEVQGKWGRESWKKERNRKISLILRELNE